MTFEEYINNPLQTRIGGFNRDMYRVFYTNKLNTIMVRENNKVDYKMYKDEKDNSYYLYIKVPSEVVKEFTYDVVIHFIRPPKGGSKVDLDKDLINYDVEFFSNDPAFVYNLEYTFKSKNMFVNDLKPKASPVALRKRPEVTNPNNQIVYCKALYFAYLIAKQRGLFLKTKYIDKYNKHQLLDQIEDSQLKIEKRQELGKEAEKDHKKKIEQNQIRKALSSKGVNFKVQNPEFKNLNSMGNAKGGMKKINFNKSKKV